MGDVVGIKQIRWWEARIDDLSMRDRTIDPRSIKITWDEIVRRAPILGALYKIARNFKTYPGYDKLDVWYGFDGRLGFKPILVEVVGVAVNHDSVLRTSEAYDIAYQKIFGALPEFSPC